MEVAEDVPGTAARSGEEPDVRRGGGDRVRRRLRAAAVTVRRHPLEVLVGTVAVLSVALALSPSSYALALAEVGAHPAGSPYLGTPRMERWDEWAVSTPLVQAVVRAGFGAVDPTSFYGESFRNLVSLPVMDWGYAFRPLHWGYAVLPPAWGFSFFWAAAAAATVVGWHRLLVRCGVRYPIAAAASIALFFSPFVQSWWTGLAPLLALFPWILLCVGGRGPVGPRAVLLAYLCASWVVSSAYLPGLVLLAFLGLVLVGAFLLDRSTRRTLPVLAGSAVVGGAVGVAYLWPVLRTLARTVYPGDRVVPGGALPAVQWLAQFVPLATTHGFGALLPGYLPETVAIGSFLPLLAIATTDLARVRRECSPRDLRPLVVLAAAFVVVSAWQVLAVAGPVGTLFGWDRAPEQRSLLVSGPLLLVGAAWALSRLPQRIDPRRVLVLGLLVAGATGLGALLLSAPGGPTLRTASRDGLLVGLVSVAVVAAGAGLASVPALRRRCGTGLVGGLVALAAVVPVAAMWATYNPVQDSRAVFRPVDTPRTRGLDAAAARRPDGAVAEPFPGAVLHGLGYRSPLTALPLPQVATFRALYPELDDAAVNHLFNRYVELGISDRPEPVLVGDGVVLLPADVLERADRARAAGTLPYPPPR